MMDSKSSKWDSQVSAVLLFGPPGTAKSTLVKSLAQRLEWQFIELSPSDFVERGIESIEQRSQEIFESLGVLRETVVLFDELDSLLIDREQLPPGTILNFTVPAMLPKMQKLAKLAKKQRVLLVFATNFFDRLDAAMVRPGRIDRRFVVLPHDRPARKAALEQHQLPVDDEMLKATSLAVHEELQRFADDYNNHGSARCAVGITPSLYASRVPHAPADRRRLQRSMERLAIEVAEVLGRKFDEPRSLSADSTREDILSRLGELRDKAASSRWADWDELCRSLISALSGP
jgi:SpoVK/Ycf46/Vps4 family AAA+-type ATPase